MTSDTAYGAGRQAGEADARTAWCGLAWQRASHTLPASHQDRQAWLRGYASGLAAYNRAMVV